MIRQYNLFTHKIDTKYNTSCAEENQAEEAKKDVPLKETNRRTLWHAVELDFSKKFGRELNQKVRAELINLQSTNYNK